MMPAALVGLAVLSLALGADAPPTWSGLHIGDEVSAWEPIHVAGPHAGTKTCPVCTYLAAPALLAFARDAAAAEWLVEPLEAIARTHAAGRLRVMLVVTNDTPAAISALAARHAVKHLMLCRPDPEYRDQQLAAYRIDPAASHTVMLYEDYIVRVAWPTLAPADLPRLTAAAESYLPHH